jgi:hypothetical protein
MKGAQNLLTHLATMHGGHLKYSFLNLWFLYHEVMGEFSQPLLRDANGSVSLQLLHNAGFDTSIVSSSTWNE